jgi:asparagine synthase (glutamine-hydrolysing)
MCGIAGMAGVADKPLLDAMLLRIRHRGPDDSGTYVSEVPDPSAQVALGNTRLSILDLSAAGHQPMSNEDGTVWVAYNGEIYNFQELRSELESDGHRFRSHTDTEILPHLYEKYGVGMVRRLNGMFAFAIWDARDRKLLIFRDRMGIKPLYYAQCGDRLYFASEIKCILVSREITAELDPASLRQYLGFLYVPNPDTMFKGIYKLPPASVLTWKDGRTSIDRYWRHEPGDYSREPEQELTRQLREIVIGATRRQLISDVPVGFFLSGGLDSTAILACAKQVHQGHLRCYNIAFAGEHGRLEQSDDDARHAEFAARHFGADFHQIVVQPDVTTLLEKAVWHLDDAVADHAAIATYLICESAKPDVTVLLSGQGGDEIFGGYRIHLTPRIAKFLRCIPRRLREGALTQALRSVAAHSQSFDIRPGTVMAYCRFSEKMLKLAALSGREQYVSARSYLDAEGLDAVLSPAMREQVADRDYAFRFFDHFEAVSNQEELNQFLAVDMQTFLPDLNLAYSDKMSMASSIESRVPLIDSEVVDFMLRVPPRLKIRGFTQKYLFKQAMRGMVPDCIIDRRKAGFGLPVRSWLRNELREMVADLLSEETIRGRGLLNPLTVGRMVRENQSGLVDWTLQLWSLLTLEVWMRTFIDRSATVSDGELQAAFAGRH